MSWVAVAIAGAAVVGGAAGMLTSQQKRDAAEKASNDAFAEINALNAPPDQQKAILLKHFKSSGVYTPQLEQAIKVGDSNVANIKENPALQDTQMQALNLIKERASSGVNAQDRANLNDIRSQIDQQQKSRLDSIRQNAQMRGQAGGGSELAQELSAAEGAGSNASDASLKVAAQNELNALQAAKDSGTLGSQIRQQNFDINNTKASAADRFKMFDTQNQQAVQNANVNAANQGNLYNLNQAQQIGTANTQLDNAELARQQAAQRQYWQDQASLASMKANARMGQSANLQSQADSTAKMYQGIGSGIAAGAGAYGGYKAKNPSSPGTVKTPESSSSFQQPGDGKGAVEVYDDGRSGTDIDTGAPVYKSHGGIIPGKAPFKGDSPLNDIINVKATPGEVVIPKTVVDHGPDAGYGYLHALLNRKDKENGSR